MVKVAGRRLTTFREDLRRRLRDPAFRAEWEALQPALQVAELLIQARQKLGLSQRQLAEKAGVKYPHVARAEGAGHLPSIETLAKLARAMGAGLEIRIVQRPRASRPAAGKAARTKVLAEAYVS
jgi:ribosome-binding protein aMBF1 (putative translation factor)